MRRQAEETLERLAAADKARAELTEAAAKAELTAREREEALKRLSRKELADAQAVNTEQQKRIALLTANVRELNNQLRSLRGLLDESEARDVANKVEIKQLSSKLNQALAQKVSELSRFRSEFFGRMRGVLGGRDGVTVVGDRFVLQSEVLFQSGSADLGAAGRAELSKLADLIREVASSAPEGLNWVLRVDGHTDNVPISGRGRFRDNWELSQARALSVVKYLVDVEGIDPERLAATGFGEFQPIQDGDDPDSRAANRRIEFKFTQR